MRIIYIVKHFHYGGSEKHVRELANIAAQEGHDVLILHNKGAQTESLNIAVHQRELILKDSALFLNLITFLNIVKEFKPDVIHAHQRYPIFLSSFLRMITGIPVVATIHGKIRHDLRSIFSRLFVSKVIVVSQNSLNGANTKPMLKEKTVYIPNGVNVCSSGSYIEKKFNLIHVSRINPRHFHFLKMLIQDVLPLLNKEIPGFRMKILGGGDCEAQLASMVREYNEKYAPSYIDYDGFAIKVSEHLAASELAIGVGRVAAEAMLAGVPVLSMNSQHAGEIITNGNYDILAHSNFVDVSARQPNAETLYEGIMKFFANKNFYVTEAEVVRNFKVFHLGWSRVFEKIEMLYSEIVNMKTSPATFRWIIARK